jgi:hypothetical protein
MTSLARLPTIAPARALDVELLVLAQRRGLRIPEVPVDWVDDEDSRVKIVRGAVDDLRGVIRLAAAAPLVRFLGMRRRHTAARPADHAPPTPS